MRVCHISLQMATGGLERLLVEFARHHDRERWEPHFLSLSALGTPTDDIRRAGAMVHLLPDHRGRKLAQLAVLTRFLNGLRPAVVHTHNAYAHLYGSVAARLVGVPVVVHTRHGRALSGGAFEGSLFRFACRLSNAVVCVSEETRQLSLQQGCPPAKCRRIWNGVDTARFHPAARPVESVFITVGRLEPVKDLATLFQGFALAREKGRDRSANAELLVVGDGRERPALEALSTRLGLGSSVRFLGERADILDLLSQAACLVNTSLSEGVSLSLLEAMACGLPVIATRVGGSVEIVEHEVSGLLIAPSSPAEVAAAMTQLLGDPERARRMGGAGRERVCEHFSVHRVVAEYERLYDLQGPA